MRTYFAANKHYIIALTVVVLFFLTMLPVARMLDHQLDRKRPMYHDRQDMAVLQYRHLEQTGTALPITLTSENSATIAGTDYSPSPGTTLTVEVIDGGFCVRAENQYGDVADWRCWTDNSDPRDSPGVAR